MTRLDQVARRAGQAVDLGADYLRSARGARKLAQDLETVESFALFVGHGRSGHTLVAALLTAHPNVVISNELDVLRLMRHGFGRDQMFWKIIESDRRFHDEGSRSSGYQYRIPGQWQGRYDELKVVGDKHAYWSTARFHKDPKLFDRFESEIGARLRLIHVTRNPFDNIATFARKSRGRNLAQTTHFHFALCHTVCEIRDRFDGQVVTVRLEDLIDDPPSVLKALCRDLDLPCPEDYVQACRKEIFDEPRRTRHDVDWPDELVELVDDEIDRFDFLDGYAFGS